MFADDAVNIQYVPIPEAVQNLTFRKSSAEYEMVFLAQDLPAFGYKSYYIKKTNGHHMKPQPEPDNMSSLIEIGNKVRWAIFLP